MALTLPAPVQPCCFFFQHRGLQLEVEELFQDGRVVSPGAHVGHLQCPAGAPDQPLPGLSRVLCSEPPLPTDPHLASAVSGPAGGRRVSRWRVALGRRQTTGGE